MSSTNPIEIKCQLVLPDNQNLMDMTYNPRLRIYLTSEGQTHLLPGAHSGVEEFKYKLNKSEEANIRNFTFNITANARLERSIITCGVVYHPGGGMSSKDCFTGSAALIKFQDYDPCSSTTAPPTTPPTTPLTTLPTTPPTIPPTTTSIAPPITSTGEPTTTTAFTTDDPKTSTELPSTTHATEMLTTTEATVATGQTGSVKGETFYSTVAVLFAVGIVLLLANIVQMTIIVKRKRVVKVPVSDDISGGESPTFENSMAKENE